MCQLFKRIFKCRIHRMGVDAIELLADVIVAWNALHAKQRLTGATIVGSMNLSLTVEK